MDFVHNPYRCGPLGLAGMDVSHTISHAGHASCLKPALGLLLERQ